MRVLVGFCLMAGVGLGRGAIAQTPAPAPDASVPTLKVSTRLTLVDVTATDSKQKPVHGLTKPDFTLKEDDKPQAIKNFEEFGAERPSTEPAQKLPPNVYSNTPASGTTTRAVNILMFDQVATGISYGLQPTPEGLKYAKEASLQYLKMMPTGTQVAVMEMDGSGLRLVQGFTSDRDLLLAAVDSIAYQPAQESRWEMSAADFRAPSLPLLCNAMNFQSAQALNALNQAALFVSGIPGRKNLLWFTPGIAWLTDYLPFSQFPLISCTTDYTKQLQQVYGRLASARVALYPIDPRGVLIQQWDPRTRQGDPERHAPQGLGDISAKFGIAAFTDNVSLDDMAKATGGKAHYSNNDLAGLLNDAAASGADYYALSYVPPLSKYDGKYHTIEVKVDRPGVQLEYRRGYTSLDVSAPLLEQAKSHGKAVPAKDSFQTAMGYGQMPVTQLVFAVKAAPSAAPSKPGVIGSLNPELKGEPLVRYSFAFDLPRDRITLEQLPDGTRKASFELGVAAYDVQGRVLNSLDERRSFVLKADAIAEFLQKPFLVPVEIDLPPGSVSVRAGVMDLPSEEMGVVEIPLNVSK
jgi:VWFA-related protein